MIIRVLALIACLVYPVTASAQAPAAPVPTMEAMAAAPAMVAPAPAMTAPAPAMVAPASVPAMAAVLAPMAAAPAPAMEVVDPEAPMSVEKGGPQEHLASETPESAPATSVPTMEATAAKIDAMSAAAAPASTAPAKPKVDKWAEADKWLGRLGNVIFYLVMIVLAIVGWAKGGEWKQKARASKFWVYFDRYFPVVEKLSTGTGWKGDDKLVELVRRIEKAIRADGDSPLTPEEIAQINREAADRAATEKVDAGAADKIDTKAVTEKPSA